MKCIPRSPSAGVLLLLAATALLSSCITRPAIPVFYYTLDYLPDTENPELARTEPDPATVHVLDTSIPRAYTRPQIVQRGVGPQFTYLDNQLWGIDLSETVAGLVEQRINRYSIFSRTYRNFTREGADYEIRSSVPRLEYVRYDGTRQASFEFEITLWQMPDEMPVVRHRATAQRSVLGDDVAAFVAEANEMLLAEIDVFLESVNRYLDTGEAQPFGDERTDDGDQSSETTEGLTGVLLLPALVGSVAQPFYTILGPEGGEVRTAQFGEQVTLPSGTYSVVLGSGPPDQRITIDEIEVSSRSRTVVEPQWAAMTIAVVDQSRQRVRVRYDIYEAETGKSYGGRISRVEEFVGSRTIWILEPDRYKVVINNQQFSALRDFVTINLVAGAGEELTIVVGADDAGNVTSMLGAGVIDLQTASRDEGPLSVTSSVNASFSFTASNEDTPDDFEVVTFFDSELGTELTYRLGPVQYDLQNDIAIGLNAAGENSLTVANDEFSLRNTFFYDLTPLYGLYARADLSTTLVGDRYAPTDPFNYVKRSDGTIDEQATEAERVTLSPPFLPLNLREGGGVNVNVLRRRRVEFGIRGGIGATQTIRSQVYEAAGTATIDGTEYEVFEEVPTETSTGLELSATASLLLPFSTTVNSLLEVFVPFADERTVSLEWENVVNLLLVNNVSLYYRFSLATARRPDDELYLVQNHGVFVRLNYLFR
ncbi:MAG TPA: ABC-type transport auxiliary lipoprotein family protein [Spirochaetia bacterium]|nr:ABC-type transport auxiliary lipoprotein family protein [Spirochaetia bacterium]